MCSSDLNGNTLNAVEITTLPTAGTLTLSGNPVTAGEFVPASVITSLQFTPDPDANGNSYASFTFQVQDNGGTANGGVDTDPTPNTFTFNVTPVNDAPTVTSTTAALPAINENDPDPPAETISDLLGANFSDATDEVPGGSHANAFAGVAVTLDTAGVAGPGNTSTAGGRPSPRRSSMRCFSRPAHRSVSFRQPVSLAPPRRSACTSSTTRRARSPTERSSTSPTPARSAAPRATVAPS